MFVIMEMKYLSDFPQDVYAPDAKIGDEPITVASYGYIQIGASPYEQKIVAYIDGDKDLFSTEMTGKYIELDPETDTLPLGYQQTCCNEFIYGRTLTKATIVAWQYTFDEEMALHRKQIDSGDITNPTDEYLVYSMFIDSIPSDKEN